MTKLLIKGEASEQALEFSLNHGEGGEIQLLVSEAGGNTWHIAAVQADGTLKLNSFLPQMDFFQLVGDEKYIKVVEES